MQVRIKGPVPPFGHVEEETCSGTWESETVHRQRGGGSASGGRANAVRVQAVPGGIVLGGSTISGKGTVRSTMPGGGRTLFGPQLSQRLLKRRI